MTEHPQAAQLAAAHERAQAMRFDETAPPGYYRGVMTDEQIDDMRERNAGRLVAAIDALGERYLLHRAWQRRNT